MAARDEDNSIVSASATERTPLLIFKDVAPTADAVVSQSTTLQEGSGSSTPPFDEGHVAKDDDDNDDNHNNQPLPKWQIFWLCIARLIEPMAFFSIFPYVNQMAQENGNLADTDVGFYSGLIESLFSLTQALVMIFWGRAADALGRKPILVSSLVGVSIATSLFGTAKTIWQMILFRCLAGVFAGTIVTIRTMLTELSTPRTQAAAFSWFAFSGNLGIFLGPLVGGALADPAHQYPKLFGHVQFFLHYPYALSSFVIAAIGFTGALTSALFVQETLRKEEPAGEENGVARPKPLSIPEILKAPGVAIVLYLYLHIALLAFAYTAVVPVFWFTPVELGGYGFAPYEISIMMAVNGAAQALWLLVAFPPLQRRFGTNGVMRACAAAYPVFLALSPLGSLVLRAGAETVFWVAAPPLIAVGCGVSMCFTTIQLALNDVAPSPRVLGTLNSLAMTGSSLTRAFAPALFTSLFALGARSQWLWGYAIWLLLISMAAWFTFAVRWLPEKGGAEVVRGRERSGEVLLSIGERREPEGEAAR